MKRLSIIVLLLSIASCTSKYSEIEQFAIDHLKSQTLDPEQFEIISIKSEVFTEAMREISNIKESIQDTEKKVNAYEALQKMIISPDSAVTVMRYYAVLDKLSPLDREAYSTLTDKFIIYRKYYTRLRNWDITRKDAKEGLSRSQTEEKLNVIQKELASYTESFLRLGLGTLSPVKGDELIAELETKIEQAESQSNSSPVLYYTLELRFYQMTRFGDRVIRDALLQVSEKNGELIVEGLVVE